MEVIFNNLRFCASWKISKMDDCTMLPRIKYCLGNQKVVIPPPQIFLQRD
jgi:hypothetical protein